MAGLMGELIVVPTPQLSTARSESKAELEFCEPETTIIDTAFEGRLRRTYHRMVTFHIQDFELLRGTPASCPLRFGGAALWQNVQMLSPIEKCRHSDNFHPGSRPVKSIDQFWTHSWHASPVLKVVVLLLEYNGVPAAAIGTTAAFMWSGLFAAGVLPGMVKVRGVLDEVDMEYSAWGVSMGVVVFVPALLCWRSGRDVFLDKICISQVNEEKKRDGVFAIGGFLSASDCLLVLLDSTYVTRLWCVFEMAAFGKLMEMNPDKFVRFLPLPHGSVFILLFVICAFSAALENLLNIEIGFLFDILLLEATTLAVYVPMRSYQVDLENLKAQLDEFSFNAAKCYCCTVGHVHPQTGAYLQCDREAVRVCVDTWFGSLQDFDAFVHQRLSKTLVRGIGRAGIPFKLVILTCLPLLWGYIDKIAARLRQNSLDGALLYSGALVLDVFTFRPLWLACCSAIAVVGARRRPRSRCVEGVFSLCEGIAVSTIPSMIYTAIYLNLVYGNIATWAGLGSVLSIATCWVFGGCFCCRLFGTHTSGFPLPVEKQTCAIDRENASVLGRENDQVDELVERESTTFSI
eukprot:TRINITY_DN13844_c0_g1_i1.p1 TRINITY_DN13844_c0_g1~~TRINITY_DN13844_c0_g1_i1.p1  ORF type:complete len:574 (-),score=64.00 TRINITY_DN13844_c0_g1_i1:27-1748(-)